MCKFCQHFEVAFTKVDKCFCGSLVRPPPQAFDSSRKMVERKIQRRGLLCCSPTIPPSQPPHLFLLSPDPRTNPELRLGLCPWLIPAQHLRFWRLGGCSDPSSQFLPSFWPCSPTGSLSSYVWGYHRVCCFTSKFKAWERASLHALPRWELCVACASGESPPAPQGSVALWGQLLPIHRPSKDRLDLPSLSPTLSRHPASFSDFLWLNISPKWTQEGGRDLGTALLGSQPPSLWFSLQIWL